LRFTFVLPLLLGALAACESEDEMTAVTLRFDALVAGEPAACGTAYSGMGTTGTDYTLRDYRLYVHDVRLVTEDGRELPVALDQDGQWQHEDVALLDFEGGSGCPAGNPATNPSVRGVVTESGPFTGVRFAVGVPFDLNHTDAAAAPAPLNVTSMFWNWQGGYKFIRIDGSTTGLSDGFSLHLGSTGCDGDPLTGGVTTCANDNRFDVALDGFDPTAAAIQIDVAPVLAESDLDQSSMAPGCMSNPMDPECAPILPRLGLGGTQQLFSAP